MDSAFAVHILNAVGKSKAIDIAEHFNDLLAKIREYVPDSRELAIVRTKLEEACFFAKKGMASQAENVT